MDTLKAAIDKLRALRPGEEFNLGCDEDGEWTADFVHPGHHGHMVEFDGRYHATGETPEEAVWHVTQLVLAQPRRGIDPPPDTRTPAQRAFDIMTDDLSASELAHFYSCLSDAYPGEIIGGFVRARDIMASTLEQTKMSATSLSSIKGAGI